jgi:hypothetical protein
MKRRSSRVTEKKKAGKFVHLICSFTGQRKTLGVDLTLLNQNTRAIIHCIEVIVEFLSQSNSVEMQDYQLMKIEPLLDQVMHFHGRSSVHERFNLLFFFFLM